MDHLYMACKIKDKWQCMHAITNLNTFYHSCNRQGMLETISSASKY